MRLGQGLLDDWAGALRQCRQQVQPHHHGVGAGELFGTGENLAAGLVTMHELFGVYKGALPQALAQFAAQTGALQPRCGQHLFQRPLFGLHGLTRFRREVVVAGIRRRHFVQAAQAYQQMLHADVLVVRNPGLAGPNLPG